MNFKEEILILMLFMAYLLTKKPLFLMCLLKKNYFVKY